MLISILAKTLSKLLIHVYVLSVVKTRSQRHCDTGCFRKSVHQMWILKICQSTYNQGLFLAIASRHLISLTFTQLFLTQAKTQIKIIDSTLFHKKNGQRIQKYLVLGRNANLCCVIFTIARRFVCFQFGHCVVYHSRILITSFVYSG